MRHPWSLATIGVGVLLARPAPAAQPPPLPDEQESPPPPPAAEVEPAPEQVAAPTEQAPPTSAPSAQAPPSAPADSRQAAAKSPKSGSRGPDGNELESGPGMVRGRHEPVVNTLSGPIGLFHTTLPDVGGNLTFRFRLHADFFRDEIVGSDQNSRVRGAVNLGFTPWKYLEVFFAIKSQANRNIREDPQRQDPEALFALGDVDFGLKGSYQWDRYGLAVGGVLGLGLLSGTQRLTTSDVNFWFDGLFSFDLRYLTEKEIPVRLSTNLGWMLDRSLNLLDWETLTDMASREVVRFGLGVNHSRFRMKYAVDFPVRLGKEKQFGIDPILEWSWDISTERDDRFFVPNYEAALPRSMSWLTIGARGNVWQGLHLDAAVDVGLASPKFEFGPPVPAWQVIVGLGWYFDTRPRVQRVEATADGQQETPPAVVTGRIVGQVIDPAGTPVAGASVSFPGAAQTSVLTDANGSFTSFQFPPGDVQVRVEVEGQLVSETSVTLAEGEDTQVTIQLEQAPAPPTGMVRGAFLAPDGTPLAVRMHVRGQGVDETFESTPDGLILLELYVGDYTATLSAQGYADRELRFTVPRDGEIQIQESFEADKPPDTPLVKANSRKIRLVGGIRFTGTDLSDKSFAGLDQLATFLASRPEYRVVEIGVHTDDRGNPRQRSEARAEAIRNYLIQKGVAPDRLVAKGHGSSRPVAVNMTASGRAKNNRTELLVRDYQESAPSGPPSKSEDSP